MTIASKTRLFYNGFIRAGGPFVDVGAKTTINATEFDYVRWGTTFYGVSDTTPWTPPTAIASPVHQGAPFDQVTAKSTINASEFDYVRLGSPFWVEYLGPPPAFNPATFFIVF